MPADQPQLVGLLATAELDLLNMLFRNSLKQAKQLKQANSNTMSSGLAMMVKDKLGAMTSKSQQRIQQNIK
jgi:hypothetical protein